MNPFDLEKEIQFYYKNKNELGSAKYQLIKLAEILEELVNIENKNLMEVYILELTNELKNTLGRYSVFGSEPNISRKIINQLSKLKSVPIFEVVKKSLEKFKNDLFELDRILNGEMGTSRNNKIFFPVTEKNNDNSESGGSLEYFKISITSNKHLKKTEFFIVPSLPELEIKLEKQINDSWIFASNYVKNNFRKKIPEFNITIQFVHKFGIYEGNSLGVVLTLGFIQELFKYFELRDSIYIETDIVATGSLSDSGKVFPVGRQIIEHKTEIAFYSAAKLFLVPMFDLEPAKQALFRLNEKFPYRELKLIPIIEFNDILSRRDILAINKQNIFWWGSRKLVKNKTILVLFLILIGLLFWFFYILNDTNPSKLELVEGRYLIKNEQGKVLWHKKTNLNGIYTTNNILWNKHRFYDIDDDGLNEMLLVNIRNNLEVALFDFNGEELWSYSHIDTLQTKQEKFSKQYIVQGIIDTVKSATQIHILIYIQHNTYYPTGILKLNLLTGEKVSDVFWHSGSISGAILLDWNKDGKKEIIAGGVSNGMGRAFLLSIDHDKLSGTVPTHDNYYFLNKSLANFNNYILFPKTDYAELLFPKYNSINNLPVIKGEGIMSVHIGEGKANMLEADFGYGVRFDNDLNPVETVIGDGAVLVRDRYVNEGKLNLPLSDSKEFLKLIMDNIEYWDGEKFAKYIDSGEN